MTYVSYAGIYTPTVSISTNVSNYTVHPCQYMRVLNTVTVSGKIGIDTTTTGNYSINLSLPYQSNFTDEVQCSGVCASAGHNEYPPHISADVVNNEAVLSGNDNDSSMHDHYFIFTYTLV